MITRSLAALAASVLLPLLSACQEEAVVARPAPVTLTVEAAGHYCQMGVLEHDGPKAQIHLAGNPAPLWFTQVRDAVAFTRLPEEPRDYIAIYVNDMAVAKNWAEPGPDNWILADDAWFVIESRQLGGMGAPEAIPFGTREAADALVRDRGGRVVRLTEIPDAYVLAPVVDVTGPQGTSGAVAVPPPAVSSQERRSAGLPGRLHAPAHEMENL
ncbi:nitrous oxide reductase accessory protein NosL [Roseibium aestuarii]|uniref:Nitrous oxide reductase accessory protein NosL n=1 Tax=Roseibium aestuarii TaxID=2600299 RepID=A0ABW4JZS8_9HYPH|nr:nitrous oxide reductase accessory protein NosL [Roseibium aestuarii]